jgi:hypothetical protein
MTAPRRLGRRRGLAAAEVIASTAVVVLVGVAVLRLSGVFVAAVYLLIDAVVGSTLM